MSGSGISWATCKSAPRSRQITTPVPHHSVFLQAGCPSCHPTNSVKALKASLFSSVSAFVFLKNLYVTFLSLRKLLNVVWVTFVCCIVVYHPTLDVLMTWPVILIFLYQILLQNVDSVTLTFACMFPYYAVSPLKKRPPFIF